MANMKIKITLHRGDKGRRVKRLQHGINETVQKHKLGWRSTADDAKLGDHTIKTAIIAGFIQGLPEKRLKEIRHGNITWWTQAQLKHNILRTKEMKKRAERRKPRLRKIRELHKKNHQPKNEALGNWKGYQVAGWMVGVNKGPDGTVTNWLQLLVNTGLWAGDLYSGFRDPEYSESLCYAMCGAPSCSGTCAGKASNHSQTGPPNWGAIDVVNYIGFRAAVAKVGAPFRNNLPYDTPHHSYTGY